MKKFTLNLLLLPLCAFSFEVNFNKNFTKIIQPDLLTTNITLSVEKKDEILVNESIEKFNKFLKDEKGVNIKNFHYTLSPRYEYIKEKSEFKGYVGDSRFNIESKDAVEVNRFINELINLKDSIKTDDIKLDISNLYWQVSYELENRTLEDLRIEALNWIDKYSKDLSSKIAKKCEIKYVNFNDYSNSYLSKSRFINSEAVSLKNSDIVPLNSEQNMSINTNFILDCK